MDFDLIIESSRTFRNDSKQINQLLWYAGNMIWWIAKIRRNKGKRNWWTTKSYANGVWYMCFGIDLVNHCRWFAVVGGGCYSYNRHKGMIDRNIQRYTHVHRLQTHQHYITYSYIIHYWVLNHAWFAYIQLSHIFVSFTTIYKCILCVHVIINIKWK